jgi:hypothetical protein
MKRLPERFMKALISTIVCILVVASWCVTSSAINNLGITDEQAFKLVNIPNVKLQLAQQIGKSVAPDSIIFLPGTGALDIFDVDKFCYTVEFKVDPSGAEGVMSALYKMVGIRPKLEKLSYWFIATRISGDIFTQTWSPAKSPYYIDNWTRVVPGETLTILPGTVIRVRKFSDPRMNIYLEVGEGSNLITKGKEGQLIQFTSSCDLEDFDKIQNTFETSDWYGIYCWNGSVTLDYTLVEYAIYGVYGGYASYVTNSILRKNYYSFYGYTNEEVVWLIQNNRFEDCALLGVYFIIDYGGLADSKIIGNIFTVVTEGFYPWAGIFCCYGSPQILNNTIQGFSTGMALEHVSADTLIQGNEITAGGRGIDLWYASPMIKGNTIKGSPEGIHCHGADTKAKITENNIRENEYGIQCWNQANPAIHFNSIEENRSYGVYNEDCSVTVDATNNWWGDATGPFHPVSNPGGLGNTVSDCVIFDPWLPSPIALLAAAPQAVANFSLGSSYPNPGNPESWFPYSLADETDVTIRIYNASGQLVRTLNLGTKPAGSYFTKEKAAYWDGRDSLGQKVASGLYFYQLKAGEFTATRKMVILK